MKSLFLLDFLKEKKEWMLCLTKKCESLHGIAWSTPSGCKDAGRQLCIGFIPPISPVMKNDESQTKRQWFFDTCLPTNKDKFKETHRTHRDRFPKGNFLGRFFGKVFLSEGSFFSKVGKPKGKLSFHHKFLSQVLFFSKTGKPPARLPFHSHSQPCISATRKSRNPSGCVGCLSI